MPAPRPASIAGGEPEPAALAGRRRPASYSAREWTPERIDVMRIMWAQDALASEIAAALGDVTKSAVIGKLTRLGLTGNGTIHANPRRKGGRPTHRVPMGGAAMDLRAPHAFA